jgi:hypothetical protein
MTIADQIEDHQARCQLHVLRLRMIARDEAGTAFSWQMMADVTQAADAILAEAEAAGSETFASGGGGPGAGTFLSVRLSRLATAANDMIAAAGAGDPAQLRRRLRRFEVLTSAIWTVQQGVSGP